MERKRKRRQWRSGPAPSQPADPFPPGYGVGPLGPVGEIESAGRIAWAAKHGTGRQRHAARVFAVILFLPLLVGLVYLIIDLVF
jgi:hypothetical protein